MGVSVRVQPFERDIQLLINETLSPSAQSREFGKAARQIIEQIDTQNDAAMKRDVKYETFVDGKQSAALETAKRVIVAEWALGDTMFRDIMKMLREKAPVLDGTYRDSIELFADGVIVAVDGTIPQAAEYFFASTVPYARKIEKGRSNQAPDGVFEAISALANKRFGNIARIKFGFRSIQGGAIGQWAGSAKVVAAQKIRNRNAAKRQEWLQRQPAILITLR
jgi:hypothetical protein